MTMYQAARDYSIAAKRQAESGRSRLGEPGRHGAGAGQGDFLAGAG